MPPVSKIDLSGGIKITGTSVLSSEVPSSNFQLVGTLMHLENVANNYFKSLYGDKMYVRVHLFSKSPLRFTVVCSNDQISLVNPIRCRSKVYGNLTIV